MYITKKKIHRITLGLFLLLLALQLQNFAFGFTQGAVHVGSVVPQGHEWITRQAAIEVLGGERALKTDPKDPLKPYPKDPRNDWPASAKAQDISLDGAEQFVAQIKRQLINVKDDIPYAATYTPVLEAILGERWVDIGGFNFLESSKLDTVDCLDRVTQEAPDIQYDHFMRKPSDLNAQGGINSAQLSTQRFIEYFVKAAMADDGTMKAWDGGGLAGEATVNRQFFLFGRALHLFEDSFSPDHTVRIADDFYRQVRQVKSYLCANGSEQHAHLKPPSSSFYETGDVIWNSMLPQLDPNDWSPYQPNNIRPYALAAIEGSKDAWAAFIRTMAKPRAQRAAYAREQATQVANNWLTFNDKEMRTWYSVPGHRGTTYVKASPIAGNEDGGNGTTVEQCMGRDWGGSSVAQKKKEFEEGRRLCLYNMVPDIANTDSDPQLHAPFFWRWRNVAYLETPPAGWNLENPPKTLTVRISIANRTNQVKLRNEGDYVYNDPVGKPENLAFDIGLQPGIPLEQQILSLKVVGMDNKVLGRSNAGLIHLYPPDSTSSFTLKRRADGFYNLYNTNDNQYVYMDGGRGKSYIWNNHSQEDKDAQWIIDGLPEPYLVSGTYGIFQKFDNLTKAFSLQKTSFIMAGKGAYYHDYRDFPVGLERQADDAYKIGISGKYISINPLDGSLDTGTKADKFYLEPGRAEGDFVIRTEDGRYWNWNNGKGLLSVAKSCVQEFNPCNPPVIDPFGAGINRNRVGRGGLGDITQECPDVKKEPCLMPTEFHIRRNWAADSK